MRNVEWLRRLIRLVEDSDIDSLDVQRLGTRVRIQKSPPAAGSSGPAVVVPAAPQAAPTPAASAPPAPPPASADEASAEVAEGNLVEVHSPMVGTFYRAPSPDEEPFVEIGTRVDKGQTLCILEAMKLMNELESEVAGIVREIAVENAEPVEFGQLLFRIET